MFREYADREKMVFWKPMKTVSQIDEDKTII